MISSPLGLHLNKLFGKVNVINLKGNNSFDNLIIFVLVLLELIGKGMCCLLRPVTLRKKFNTLSLSRSDNFRVEHNTPKSAASVQP